MLDRVDVLGGPEVDSTPSEIPQNLIRISAILAFPFEVNWSDLSGAGSSTVTDTDEGVTSVSPSRFRGLSWWLVHIDVLCRCGRLDSAVSSNS